MRASGAEATVKTEEVTPKMGADGLALLGNAAAWLVELPSSAGTLVVLVIGASWARVCAGEVERGERRRAASIESTRRTGEGGREPRALNGRWATSE